MKAKRAALKEENNENCHLALELRAARSPIDWREEVLRDFAECLSTEIAFIVRLQAAIYCNCLDILLAEAQTRVKYLGFYLVHVGENDYSPHLCGIDRNDK